MNFNKLDDLLMSFMLIINKSGPRTEPCGTPHLIYEGFEIASPIETNTPNYRDLLRIRMNLFCHFPHWNNPKKVLTSFIRLFICTLLAKSQKHSMWNYF